MRGYNEEALHRWLGGEGFSFREFEGDGTLWGYTSQSTKEVGLWVGLRRFQRLPTLMHECLHVRRGDDGHQPQAVEARIDEAVAVALVDRERYAWAESQYGWHAGAIAAELEVPKWVIQAYRRTLAGEVVPQS